MERLNVAAAVAAPSSYPSTRALRRGLATLLLPALLFAGSAHAQSCAVGETPVAMGFSGVPQSVTVPAGVTSATVYLSGAQGGAGRSGAGTIGGSPNSPGGTGGLGGRVRGTLALTPGQTLWVNVGGQASQAINPGGIGQGVDGIGGGATDLRVGANTIANRVGIAGGGGGGGNAGWSTTSVIAGGAGGIGGGGTGGTGATVPGGPGPFGGGGGQVGTGGAGGGGCGTFPATTGNAANGDGGDSFNFSGSFSGAGFGGGGGGGATVGAGGGGAGVGTTACQQNWNGGGGGGAGGSSAATGLTGVVFNNGVQAGNGAALICWAPPTFSVGGPATGQTGAVTLQLDATSPASTQQVVVAQAATTFVFPTRLPQGANWTASVISAPAGQLCSVAPVSGAAIAADVTSLVLTCQTVVVTVSPATVPAAAFGTPYSQTLTASSANGGTAPYSFLVSAGALPAGLTLSAGGVLSGTPTTAGSFNFTVQATSSNGFSGTRAYTLGVAQAAQAITAFAATPSAPVFSPGGTFAVSATGGASGNPVVFASTTPGVCTVSGTTVTMVAAGACSLTADQAGDTNYSAAPQATLSVAIGQAAQAITAFAATPSAPVFSPGGTFSVSATGGASGNPVVFASTTAGICTVSGSTVTMVAAGTCSLTADQAGNANYAAAPQADLDVAIGQAAQAITAFAATPPAPVFSPGGTFTVSAAGGASGNPVVFAATSASVCTVSGATVTMVSAGTCSLTADQAGDANYLAAPQATLDVAIGPGAQAITAFAATPSAPVFSPGGTFGVSATPSASTSPVVFASTSPAVCTVSGGTATIVAAGTCTLTADQAGDTNYSAAPQVTLNVTIGQATQAITGLAATPSAPVFSPGGTFAVSATPGASTSPVVFGTSTPAVCSVSGSTVTTLAAGTCTVTADQAADTNYSAAPQVTLNVTIGQATQAITAFAATPSAPVFSPGGTFTVAATGGASGNPVVFASTTSGVCTVSGTTVTTVSAGTCSLTANQAGNANYLAAPQATLDVAIGQATQAITAFSATPSAPVFSPGGTFTVSATPGASTSPVVFASSSPAVCTVSGSTVTTVSAGTCSLTANQAADTNYSAAPQVTLDVAIGQATQAITGFVANPAAPVYSSGGTFALSVSGGASGNPVVFASTTPAVCTVSGSTVTTVASGSCALTANQAGNANYTAAPQVALTVNIGLGTPSITWIGNQVRTMGEGAFDLPNPTSNSAGAFTFTSSDAAVATVSGRTVTLVGPGVTTLTVTQAANGSYAAATRSITLTVSDRPDPSRDPSVVGGLQAQVDASLRFATAQQGNIRDRLRQQRHATENVSVNGLGLSMLGSSGSSLSFGGSQVAGGRMPSMPEGWALWTAGTVTWGDRDGRLGAGGHEFLSDGLTLGADWRVSDTWLFGVAGGFGWDSASLDGSMSDIDGTQHSLSVYGLWRLSDRVFIDGLLGWGRLDFDITRWSTIVNAKANATRDGDQAFASLTFGYESLGLGGQLTSYGRFDASRTTLDAYREYGLGIYDLAYGEQDVDHSTFAVGVEASYLFETAHTTFRPYWLLEYRKALQDDSDVAVNYVQAPAAVDYRVGLRGWGDDTLVYGGGIDVDVTTGWRLSFLVRREHASNTGASTTLGLLLSFTPGTVSPVAPVAMATVDGTVTADDAEAAPTTGGRGR